MDHDLAYRALASGGADVTDVYTTDAEIHAYELRVLEDDRQLLHDATRRCCSTAPIWRRARPPRSRRSSASQGSSTTPTMIALNERAKLARVPESEVADRLRDRDTSAARRSPRRASTRSPSIAPPRRRAHARWSRCRCWRRSPLAVPLGIVAARRPRLGRFVVGAAGLLQTIPSLALLVLLIPLLGIGSPPAIAALFLYGLLPIVRNTHAGLVGIPEPLRDLGARARPAARARACASSSCRWRCRPSSPASRRRR